MSWPEAASRGRQEPSGRPVTCPECGASVALTGPSRTALVLLHAWIHVGAAIRRRDWPEAFRLADVLQEWIDRDGTLIEKYEDHQGSLS